MKHDIKDERKNNRIDEVITEGNPETKPEAITSALSSKEAGSVTEALYRVMRALRRRHGKGHHHPRGYHKLLRILARHEGASAKELAQLMEIRPASLAELLSKMEGHDLITRTKDEKDRRIHRIFLTPNGKELLQAMQKVKADEPIIGEILTKEEQYTLIQLCNKLTQGLATGDDAEESPPLSPAPAKGETL